MLLLLCHLPYSDPGASLLGTVPCHHILLLHNIITITIIHHHQPFLFFTVQPTNFQHVQICCLCNHADDLATIAYIKASVLNEAESLLLSISINLKKSLRVFHPFIHFNVDYLIR